MQAGAILMVLVVLMIYTNEDIQEVVNRVLFRQSIIIVIALTFYVLANVIIGADVNQINRDHIKSIMGHMGITLTQILRYEEKIKQLNRDAEGHIMFRRGGNNPSGHVMITLAQLEAELEAYRETLEVLHMAKDSIEKANELLPIKVFGVEATYSFAYTIATTVATFFIYLAATVHYSY